MITKVALLTALGLVLSALDIEAWASWSICGCFLAWGWHMRAEGYDDATETAQAVWQAAQRALEEVRAHKQQQQDTGND
jgi:hypothetical protein